MVSNPRHACRLCHTGGVLWERGAQSRFLFCYWRHCWGVTLLRSSPQQITAALHTVITPREQATICRRTKPPVGIRSRNMWGALTKNSAKDCGASATSLLLPPIQIAKRPREPWGEQSRRTGIRYSAGCSASGVTPTLYSITIATTPSDEHCAGERIQWNPARTPLSF